MISDERMEKALRYLAETDDEFGVLKTAVARAEWTFDFAKRSQFLVAEGKTVEERKASAETSGAVSTAHEFWMEALVTFERMKAKRATQELIIEVWRSVNASKRKGNL